MKLTLSAMKADIGSIGGHIRPSWQLLEAVQDHVRIHGSDLLLDSYISFTGDDVAVVMSHTRGANDEGVHQLCWNAFAAGAEVAKRQGLYGAGQDLLTEVFPGNLRGTGPAVTEMEFEERPNEPFLFFAADKTDPGCYNLPLYMAFADPMNTPGLMLSPDMNEGFRFVIMDAKHTDGDRVIELNAPEDLYAIATLLRDAERYVVDSVWSRATGEVAVSVSTSRLHNNAGKYTGNNDPVMLMRVQKSFPATGEMLAPYAIGPYVAGCMRGSHQMPLMPVALNSGISYFDGPPVVSCAAFAMHEGKFTEPVDCFAHPFWDHVRDAVSAKAIGMRRQGFFGAAMLPMSELECTGIVNKLKALDEHFTLRG